MSGSRSLSLCLASQLFRVVDYPISLSQRSLGALKAARQQGHHRRPIPQNGQHLLLRLTAFAPRMGLTCSDARHLHFRGDARCTGGIGGILRLRFIDRHLLWFLLHWWQFKKKFRVFRAEWLFEGIKIAVTSHFEVCKTFKLLAILTSTAHQPTHLSAS